MHLARAAYRRAASGLATIPALARDLREIRRLVGDPALSLPYYPDEPRKTRARMLADLLLWRVGRGEVNRYYFCWGMDRVDGPRARDLLSYRQFTRLRDRRNARGGPGWLDYTAMVRDKYLFSILLEGLGYPSPPLVALTGPGEIEWLGPRRQRAPLASLLEVPGGVDVFCKPRFGMQGTGVFRLQVCDGRAHADGLPTTIDDLTTRMGHCVLQRPVVQHPVMAELHPSSVNTLRVITVRDREGPRAFSRPLARIGFGGSVVDNGNAGGIQVFVDPGTGRMVGPGLMLRGGVVTHHPDSGIALDGFEIPHYERAIELAVRLHGELPGLHSIGWDLAMTDDGPVFIEGNDNWAAGLRLGLEPGFREEFKRLCSRR
ncbi:MAG TPA: sugar-transfer associated ATP-grasp domain-containing protein [Gemmatimonadales bacterium]